MSTNALYSVALTTVILQIAFLASYVFIVTYVPAKRTAVRFLGVLGLASLTCASQVTACEHINNAHWRSAITPLLWIQFMSSSELILVRRYRGRGSFNQLSTSLSLLWKLRRIGSKWHIKSVPVNRKAQGRLQYIMRRSLKILVAYMALSLMSQAPPLEQHLIARSKQALMPSGLRNLSGEDLIFRIVSTASFWIVTAIINLLMFEIVCLLSVCLLLSRPGDCPPLYGSLACSYTIRGFWGTTWHQCLRSGLTGHADGITRLSFPYQQGVVPRYTRLFLSFFISGLIHHSADVAMGITHQDAGSFKFFVIQPLGIMAEDAIQHFANRWPSVQTTSRLKTYVGYIWVISFLSYTTPTWFYAQQRMGIDASKLLPYHPIPLSLFSENSP